MATESIYRDKTVVEGLVKRIRESPIKRPVGIMHVCGTHENVISRFGLRDLLPDKVDVIAGPGCPVCVCPGHDIEFAVKLALEEKTVIATFGDMVRVPSSAGSLADARTQGADIRVVYGPFDAIKIAKENTEKEVVLFAVGFETTACGVASLAQQSDIPKNFSLLISHRLIPPSMEFLLGVGDLCIDGFLIPGHVAAVMGMEQYRLFPEAYRIPTVAAGFEPVDVLMGILAIVTQIKERYKMQDARCRFNNPPFPPLQKGGEGGLDINPGCSCHLIMIGKIKPTNCPLFGNTCIPEAPYGPCMVSMDGTCRVWYKYKRNV